MHHKSAIKIKEQIKDDNPLFIQFIAPEFYKSPMHKNNDHKTIISLMIFHKSINCLVEYCKEYGEIDMMTFLEKDAIDIFLLAMGKNIVKFKSCGRKRINRFIDTPPYGMKVSFYLPKAAVLDKPNFLRYLLRSRISVFEILETTKDDYALMQTSINHLKITEHAKNGRPEVAVMLAEAAINEIWYSPILTKGDLAIRKNLTDFIEKNS